MEVTQGAEVFTSDGVLLGTVKRLESNAFQIDAPRQFDYWLEVSIVVSSSETRADLSVSEADLGGYKMDRPHDHNAFQERPDQRLDPSNVRGQQLRRHI